VQGGWIPEKKVPDLNCEAQDLLLEVVDLKQEVPDLRSGGILHNLTPWYTRPKTVTHPGTNRARCALTSFMRRTPLATTPRHYTERECADTIGTVLVPWAGHFQR